MAKIEERLKELVGTKVENLKKPEIKKPSKHGGRREGSGRMTTKENVAKRGIQAYVDEHTGGKHLVQVTDPKTGQTALVEKPRIVLALEKLWQMGMEGKGDADALNKWLDRALGKPKQVLAGDVDTPPFQLQINIANILKKAYGGDNNDKGN